MPVSFSVASGPGKLSGTTLTVTGVGTIVVSANQSGNTTYAAAAQVSRTIVVNKAPLTVAAVNKVVKAGSAIPALTYTVAGFVNGDTAAKATTGAPKLTTTATVKSAVGLYPITVALNTLKAANYAITLKNGTVTLTGQVAKPAYSLKSGTYKGAQTVTISTTTPGAAIYYTTNGTTPSGTNGTKYAGALKVTKTVTIKAVGVLAGCTASQVAGASYTIL